MGDSDKGSRPITLARKRAQEQMERALEEQRRIRQRRRVEIAKHGVRSYDQRKIGEAVKHFHLYLQILEELKDVGPGQLRPNLFDKEKDLAELLLISGIYWDLAKLYDKTKTDTKYKEFSHYLEKFILFSRGMPFTLVCVETLRKYISNEKPSHKEDFKNALKILSPNKCFIATSLVDHLPDPVLPRLWRFRDEVLERSLLGRAFIGFYYATAPGVAFVLDRMPERVRERAANLVARVSVRCEEWSRSGLD
jgi:hypothetical protein